MPRRSSLAGCLVLALCLGPLAAGQAVPLLDASRATLSGAAGATLSLDGVTVEGPACPALASPRLSVANGTLQVDRETTAAWVNPTVSTPRNNTRETTALSGATADGFRLRAGCRLLLLPLPGGVLRAEAEFDGAAVLPPATVGRSFEPRASFDRPAMGIPAGRLPTEAARSGVLGVQAPFRLVVWEASFEVHDGNGTRSVETGTQSQPVVSGPVPVQGLVQQEAYFEVVQGNLSMPLVPGVQAHATSLALEVRSGRLGLSDPRGTLPLRGSAIPSGARLLELGSPTAVTLRPATGRLGADVHGAPPVAYLDGVAIRPEPAAGWGAPLLLATAAAGLLAVAAVRLRARAARRRMERLDGLLAGRRFGEALALARRAQARGGGRREDARLAEAACLIQLARFGDALGALDGGAWSAAAAPTRDYLLASAEAGLGRPAAATRHLAHCLLKAPSFAAEALANPLLASVVRDALAANRPAAAGESYA